MDISIVVPTKNRFQYISKLINYYDKVNYSGTLIIVDSSSKEILTKTEQLIKAKKKLKINYVKFTSNEVGAKAKICPEITTKYTIQAGDDDYYSPDGLSKIITFLDSNTDYASASGYGYSVGYSLKENKVLGSFKYNIETSEKDSSYKRIQEMPLNGNVADYAVFRTEIFQKIFKNLLYDESYNIYCIRQYWEYTFKLYKFLYGKSTELDIFFLIRFRVPENSFSFSKSFYQVYLEDKKSFFKAYFYVVKKLMTTCKNLKKEDSQIIFLLSKQKIKQLVLIQIRDKHRIYYKCYKKIWRLKNLIISLSFKIIRLNTNIVDILTNKKSKKYKDDFTKIIESIIR